MHTKQKTFCCVKTNVPGVLDQRNKQKEVTPVASEACAVVDAGIVVVTMVGALPNKF